MMNWRFLRCVISVFCAAICLVGCIQSDYTKLVKKELGRGIRQDSVVFGINLGDTRNEFYGKCFDLNKKRIVTEGPSGATVQYLFADSLVHDSPTNMRLLFIPLFDEKDVIAEINLEFSYIGWAPWNEEYQSEKLKEKVLKILMAWYKGNEFMSVKVKESYVPIKLDGNRRMIMYIKDEQNVVVKVQDILHPFFKHSVSSNVQKPD